MNYELLGNAARALLTLKRIVYRNTSLDDIIVLPQYVIE